VLQNAHQRVMLSQLWVLHVHLNVFS
jgi:hypothetical protein